MVNERAVEELLSRGVAEVIVKEKLREKLLSGERLRIKLGIDPTSPDLHIGRAVPLLKLRDFQQLGHQIVFIVGDFTAVIGDTSDKDSERPMLEYEVIEHNKKSYFEQAGKILDLSQVEMRYNSEWLGPLTYREIGQHADLFSVSDFIARENIAKRLQDGKRVSLREVLYPLMQGYDSVAMDIDVELCGTDQTFNALAGRTLQRDLRGKEKFVVTTTLLENPVTKEKMMSKSLGTGVYLNESAESMHAKILQQPNENIVQLFTDCTYVAMDEIAKIRQAIETEPGSAQLYKRQLAVEITRIYHPAFVA